MTAAAYTPGRGDVVWLTFSPQVGREQAGRRPAVVLSKREYNQKVGLALVCPVTSRVKGYPFEVGLPAGLAVEGVALADQIRSVDWRGRQTERIGTLGDDVVARIRLASRALLD